MGAEPDKPHCESGEPSCGGWFEVKAPSAGKGRGHSSMVEPQPSKLMMRVRFPLPAPKKGSSFAHIAQSVEHFLGKEEVTGSNPVMSSNSVVRGARDTGK